MRPPTPRFFAKLPEIERRDRSEDVVSRSNVPGEPRESRRDEQEDDLRVQAGELTYFLICFGEKVPKYSISVEGAGLCLMSYEEIEAGASSKT